MQFCKRIIIITSQFTRNFCIRRKKPIDPDYVKEMPIFQYTTSSSSKRRVYVWGNAKTGALGVPKLKKRDSFESMDCILYPKRSTFAERNQVVTAATGFGFSAFAVRTDEGDRVYGCGLNSDSQIGCHTASKDKYLDLIIYPQEVYLPFINVHKLKILKLSAGRAHLAVLTDEGLYLLGNNSYGQCGRKIVHDEDYVGNNYVHYIPNINDEDIIDVICGQDHTIALTQKGNVYSCGLGADGQTGIGHFQTEGQFTKLLGDIQDEHIVKVSSACDFVLAINKNGEVFGWGNNEYSQIDLEHNPQQVDKPTNIKMCKDLGNVVDVAAGGSFCVALNEDGSVFTWGFGLLGAGPEVQVSKKPLKIPSQLFGLNDFNPYVKVEKIHCGLGHMTAITNHGDLYIWGRNREGCLGLGNDKDQYFPLKVSVGGLVADVMCGLDHTIAICKPFI